MVLVIGGRSQGKSLYAHENYKDASVFIDGLQDVIKGWLVCLPENYAESPGNTCAYYMSEADILSSAFIDNIMSDIPEDAVVICDEVGCGIVPIDRSERLYRDVVGHVCCYAASRAESVIRVSCGIGTRIK